MKTSFWSYEAIWCPNFRVTPKKGELYYMNTNIKLKETSACKVQYPENTFLNKFQTTLDISGLKIQRKFVFYFTQANTYEIMVEIIADKSQINI